MLMVGIILVFLTSIFLFIKPILADVLQYIGNHSQSKIGIKAKEKHNKWNEKDDIVGNSISLFILDVIFLFIGVFMIFKSIYFS